jgi:hypothetical protein
MSFSEPNYNGPWGLLNLFEDDWLVTRRATKLFFASAVYILVLTSVLLGWTAVAHSSPWMKLALDGSGGLGAVAIFFLWLGMLRYWIRIDGSKKWLHRLSLVLLVAGFWYGACFYYFAVYLPQSFQKNDSNA